MRIEVYVNDAEYKFIKGQSKGFVRRCVQKQMKGWRSDETSTNEGVSFNGKTAASKPANEGSIPSIPAKREMSACERSIIKEAEIARLREDVEVGVANIELNENLPKEWKCTKCGKRLPYFKAKKCKMCGNTMNWSK